MKTLEFNPSLISSSSNLKQTDLISSNSEQMYSILNMGEIILDGIGFILEDKSLILEYLKHECKFDKTKQQYSQMLIKFFPGEVFETYKGSENIVIGILEILDFLGNIEKKDIKLTQKFDIKVDFKQIGLKQLVNICKQKTKSSEEKTKDIIDAIAGGNKKGFFLLIDKTSGEILKSSQFTDKYLGSAENEGTIIGDNINQYLIDGFNLNNNIGTKQVIEFSSDKIVGGNWSIPIELNVNEIKIEDNNYLIVSESENDNYEILSSIKNNLGKDYLDGFCKLLTEQGIVEKALVLEVDLEMGKMSAISHFKNGEKQNKFRIPIKGTPCEVTIGSKRLFYKPSLHINDPEYFENTLYENYIGMPIINSQGVLKGVLIGLTNEEIKDLGKISKLFHAAHRRISIEMFRENTSSEILKLENHLDIITKSLTDGVVVINDYGIIQKVNLTICKIFGYSESQLIGESINILMPENIAKHHDMYLKKYRDTKKNTVFGFKRTLEGKRSDGTVFPIKLGVNEIPEQDLTINGKYLVGTIEDITKQELLNRTFKIIQDMDSTIEYTINEKISKCLEFITSEIGLDTGVLAKYITGTDGNLLNGKLKVKNHFKRNGGKTLEGQEFELIDTYAYNMFVNGENFIILNDIKGEDIENMNVHEKQKMKTYLSYKIFIGNQLYGVISFGSKHIIKKELTGIEIEAIKSIAEWIGLQIYIKDQFDKNSKKIQKLEELSERKNNFISSLSHDLRTPLNSISGFSQLIKMLGNEKISQNPEKIKEYIDSILSNAENLSSLIDDILELTKIESGKMEFIESPTNFRLILEDQIATVFEGLKIKFNTNQTLKINYDTDIENIYLDSQKFVNIINNLISNAVKYSGNDSKILISVKYKAQFKALQLYIQDNGEGLTQEEIDIVLNKYGQTGKNSNEASGSGLGLHIVKGMIKAMGMGFEFKSVKRDPNSNINNSGTEIMIQIPTEKIIDKDLLSGESKK